MTRTQLPRGSMGPLHPASSPDASALAFLDAGAYTATRQPLVLLEVSAGEMMELDTGNIRSPTWAPDGSAIYYVSDRGGSLDVWRQSLRASRSRS